MLLRPLRLPLVLFVSVIVSGTLGYRFIEGWSWLQSLWMVVITLTTIGYTEPAELSDLGRWFTLGLIVGGLTTVSYALANLSTFFLDGGLKRHLADLKRRRIMKDLDQHVIVVGLGRTGREIAADLQHARASLIVIDVDEGLREHCESDGLTLITGDATNDEVLRLAGIERASALAVATSSDAVNVFVTLTAHHLNPDLKIITQVNKPETAEKARRAGASGVVNPHSIGGTTIANALLRPHSATFLEHAFARTYVDLSMEDIEIDEGSTLIGPLKALQLRARFKVIVVAIRRDDGEIEPAPGPDSEVAAGDVLVVVGRPDDLATTARAAREG